MKPEIKEKQVKEIVDILNNDGYKIEKMSAFNPLEIKDIVGVDYGEYEWIVDKLIPAQGVTMISGRPKSGKSFLILYLLNQIVNGNKAFDQMETKQTKVLLIDEENSKRGLARRARKILSDNTNFKIMSLEAFKVDRAQDREWLKQYITDNEIKLVVFDSFRRIHNKDENKSEGIAELYDCFKDIMTTDCAIVIIHHNRKISKFEKVDMESMRGSGDIGAMVDSFILIESDPLKDRLGSLSTLTTVLREDYTPKPFQIEWFDEISEENEETNIVFEYKGVVEEDDIKVERAQQYIIEIVKENDGMCFKDLCELLKEKDIGKSNVRNAIKILEQKGSLDFYNGTGRQHKTRYYIFRDSNVLEETHNKLEELSRE